MKSVEEIKQKIREDQRIYKDQNKVKELKIFGSYVKSEHTDISDIKTLESMSDDVVMDDIMYRLYLLDKVKKGQRELEMGNYHISEDIKEDIENW